MFALDRPLAEQSKSMDEKPLDEETSAKKVISNESAPAKHHTEKEKGFAIATTTAAAATVSLSTNNNSRTSGRHEAREPVNDKKSPREDGDVRKEELREKMDVEPAKEAVTKRPETEASKEAKESKLADIVLPEFTRVMVTKLSRNVTQVCKSLPLPLNFAING